MVPGGDELLPVEAVERLSHGVFVTVSSATDPADDVVFGQALTLSNATFAVVSRLTGHQPGRHPHHRLTAGQQVSLEPASQMATVLDRPTAIEPAFCPLPRLEMAVLVALHVLSASFLPRSSTATKVWVLLCVDSDRHMVAASLAACLGSRRRVGWVCSSDLAPPERVVLI